MHTPILEIAERFQIGLTGNQAPFFTASSFTLPEAGTYTLEGPNGSGKSLFIKMLTGTLPGVVSSEFVPALWVDGLRRTVGSYRDAASAGVVAVFQDDHLISSMTIFDYLVLAHSTTSPSDLWQYAWDLIFSWIVHPVSAGLRQIGPAASPSLLDFLERIEPKRIDWKDRKSLRQAAERVLREHGADASILDQIPGRLSGGGRAVARILSARLYKKTRVLLLDEAFNSVERNVWPRLLETIKKWAHSANAAVMAITHSKDEVAAWEPRIRFEIGDRQLRIAETFCHATQRRYGGRRRDLSAIYQVTDAEDDDAMMAVCSAMWQRLGSFKRIIWVIEEGVTGVNIERTVPAGVRSQQLNVSPADLRNMGAALETLLGRISSASKGERVVIVVAGGQALLALANFATLLLGEMDLAGFLVLLTSFESAAHVVLSNTLSVGLGQRETTAAATCCPTAYFLALGNVSHESLDSVRAGLTRCLRLGLLFDEQLFRMTCAALSAPKVDTATALQLFKMAIAVLNDLADLDPDLPSLRHALEMGDNLGLLLHASDNDNEAATRLFALILELSICRSDDLIAELVRVSCVGSYMVPEVIARDSAGERPLASYQRVRIVALDHAAQFNVTQMRSNLASRVPGRNSDISRFANEEIRKAIRDVSMLEVKEAVLRLRAKLQQIAC